MNNTNLSDGAWNVKNIRRMLRMGVGVNQKLGIIAKFPEPPGHVRGVILDYRGRDSSFAHG
jgi:hypothetical protein